MAPPVVPAGPVGPPGSTTRVGAVCGGTGPVAAGGGWTARVAGVGTTAVRSPPPAGSPAGRGAVMRVVSSDKQGLLNSAPADAGWT
ncbi:hypothetical protein GCM10010413_35170 [Promicromonospora sukumoe]